MVPVPQPICGHQRTTWGNWFSPSTIGPGDCIQACQQASLSTTLSHIPVVYFLVHNMISVFFLSGHGTSFNIDCNICSCFAGNLVCFSRPCLSEHSSDDDRSTFTGSHGRPEPVLQGPSFLALIFLLGIARNALTANVHSNISIKSECNIPSSLTLCFPPVCKGAHMQPY